MIQKIFLAFTVINLNISYYGIIDCCLTLPVVYLAFCKTIISKNLIVHDFLAEILN